MPRKCRLLSVLGFCVLGMASLLALPAVAQDDSMVVVSIPLQPASIELGTGALPGATHSEAWYRQYGKLFARNVRVATLTPFLPDPDVATGTAVIVAPGGGFRSLSMENEGWDVARALAARGVAAFVLKYRLVQTPADLAGFNHAMRELLSGPVPAHRVDPVASIPTLAPQIEDARAAFALVRARAGEWGVDSQRVGMVGFSAGAMLTIATTLAGVEARPAFIGTIYGPLAPVDVPADAPPLFVAIAADDGLFAGGGFGLVEGWRAAGRPVEFHLYEKGGHGFGMYPKPTTSTGWFEAFSAWLRMHGWMERKKGSGTFFLQPEAFQKGDGGN